MSSSPMTAPREHDVFVLLDGAKEWRLPGMAEVDTGLSANVDSMDVPGDETAVTQTQEASGEVEVKLTMWTAEQWDAYQHILGRLRRGTEQGPAVFTCAHPEVRARRIKRLYFQTEKQSPYSPREGYRVTLKFTETLKKKAQVQSLEGGQLVDPAASGGGSGGGGSRAATTATGQAVYQAAVANLVNTPRSNRQGTATTANVDNCSTWARWVGQDAGMDPGLFGASALETSANFRRAGLAQTYGPSSIQNMKLGDFVFYDTVSRPWGHVGVVVGFDKDGMPLVAGNNRVSYRQSGNRDARGTVRMTSLGTPTSIGRAGGFANAPKPKLGPVAPAATNPPSAGVGK